MVVKKGFMAGASFGGRATSFDFVDIGGVQVNTGMVNGTIEIHSAALGATKAGDFFTTRKKEDPYKLPNCIPIAKKNLATYEPYLAQLRTLIGDAKKHIHQPVAPTSDDVSSRLERIVELHRTGVLSDEEFAAAKQKAINS